MKLFAETISGEDYYFARLIVETFAPDVFFGKKQFDVKIV